MLKIKSSRAGRVLLAIATAASIGAATTVVAAAPAQASAPYSKIYEIAKGQIGTLEGTAAADKYFSQPPVPGGYKTATTPWCAGFVSWVGWMAGYSPTPFKSASVDAWVDAARHGWYDLHIQPSPRAGDLVAFQWKSHTGSEGYEWDHIGIITSVGSGYYYTIEGNTSNPNGGKDGVFAKNRRPSDAKKVVYIKFAA